MDRQKWEKVVALMPFFILAGLAVAMILQPDKDISKAERRHLAQFPLFSVEKVSSGTFVEELGTYLQDQFPGREYFRSIKAELETSVLGKRDTGGYYRENGVLFQIDAELSEKNVTSAAENFSKIANTYFPETSVYVSVIPDKSYYAKGKTYPKLDYEKLTQLVQKHMPRATYIPLSEQLTLGDYYATDSHWRQESIGEVAEYLMEQMELRGEAEGTVRVATDKFFGGYAGGSAFITKPETMSYVTNTAIEDTKVYDYEAKCQVDMYAWEKLEGADAYDFYLWGPRALLTMTKEHPSRGKRLLLFRDSFGSSVAPLLLEGYDEITLIDLRYVSMDYAIELLGEKEYTDILFLYSGSMLNHSNSMKF